MTKPVEFTLPENKILTDLAQIFCWADVLTDQMQRDFYQCLGWRVDAENLWWDPTGANAGWPEMSYGRLDDLRIMRRLWSHHFPDILWKMEYLPTPDTVGYRDRPFIMESSFKMRTGGIRLATYAASRIMECALPTLFLMTASSGYTRNRFKFVYQHPYHDRLEHLEKSLIHGRTVT